MPLHAVIVGGVYPPQCIVVWDRESSAKALADHLNATVRNVVYTEPVDSFFPSHTCPPDAAWLAATDAYLQGHHLYGGSDI